MNNKHSVEFSHDPLIEYVRDRHNQKVGVVVACKFEGNDNVVIGHSKANLSRGDKFNKDLGLHIAIDRAISNSTAPIPSSILDTVNKMKSRAIKYFKVEEQFVLVGGSKT